MRIARAAELAGVPTHVLRHWEDELLLRPGRRAGNQRDYTQDQVDQAVIIRRLRVAGVGIPTLRQLLAAPAAERGAILAAVAGRLEQEAAQAHSAAEFLRHTTSCSHAVIEECPQCARYARGGPGER
ncbi:helix-turn-helix domain-containing protein [Arthrobacter sp. NPDC090010]|uniref:helix-turn-helix domain-containing protein n=1 Tax=Arthrobacter sp. NPDC090010 TaxID=3363942 RepID=UPI0037F5DB5A